MNNVPPSILIVDDNKTNLASLASRLMQRLPGAEVRTWQPTEDDGPPADAFDLKVGDTTDLVVVDYDLTTTVKGLFGLTIVSWCQSRGIPVGEYSRANITALPREPNLFELRVPTDEQQAADFIARICTGLQSLRTSIENKREKIAEGGSLAWVLSTLLSRPYLESQFAAYMPRLGAANSSLIETFRNATTNGKKPDENTKTRLLVYLLGHVMANSVLKYPGPILTTPVLCAYLTTCSDAFHQVMPLFEEARYRGPFSKGLHLYWREDVDKILDDMGTVESGEEFEFFGDYNRRAVEQALGSDLPLHKCDRCDGNRGGFWCPFTLRTICEQSDCSVPASSWIPSGAQLCRVERDFFDEWSPILGL